MKFFTKKSIVQKILSILVIIVLFEYSVPKESKADSDWGGALFSPIQSLTLSIADVGTNLLNLVITGEAGSILTLSRLNGIEKVGNFFKKVGTFLSAGVLITAYADDLTEKDFKEEIELPIFKVTPEKIFSNKIPLFDVNIIHPNTYKNEAGENVESSANILQETISKWYVALRNIALVAFLSVLVYIGIRILLTSTGKDKSKYKQMLSDWIIGLCLLFVIHYIMSFALLATEKITNFFGAGITDVEITSDASSASLAENPGGDNKAFKMDDTDKQIVELYNEGGRGPLRWKTDIMGYVRFMAQKNIESSSTATQMGYVIMYLVLVIYTVMFCFQYLKRLFSITFLTLMAPFVALSYPLDKMANGSAQAFNKWLKEYLFNLLLQPMHLILYTVLAGSAINLVVEHPIYAIVVLGFLLEAEKIVRKMFKFDDASTTGAMAGGAFTGAAVMSGMNAIVNRSKNKGLKSGDKKDSSRNNGVGDSKVRYNRSADNSSDENNFIDKTLQSDMIGDGNNDNDAKNNINSQYDDYLDDINNPDNHRADFGEGIQNPELNDPNYMYMHPEEYSDGKYVGPENNINDSELNIRQYEPPAGYDESKVNIDMPKRKIKVPNKLSRAAKYAGAAARYYGPKAGIKAIKTGAKIGASVIGAGTLATVGLAAGIATDNDMNILKYTAAGLTGGALAGNAIASRAVEKPKGIYNNIKDTKNNINDNVAKEMYKNDPKGYKQYLNERSDKEFLSDKDVKQQYIEAFGKNNADSRMKDAIKYRQHGVTDNKLIIKAMKQNSPSLGEDLASDRRIVSAKLASNISNEKDMEAMTKRLKSKGISDKNIEEQANIIRSMKDMV